jgi:hypothetical protein
MAEPSDTDSIALTEHLLSCPGVKRVGLTFRHNIICAAVGAYFSNKGYLVTHEPRFYELLYDDASLSRPDITIFSSPPVAVDITVCKDPAAADLAKVTKHRTAVQKTGNVFLPLPIGIFGEIGDRPDQILEAVLGIPAKFITGFDKHAMKKTIIDAWITGTAAILRNIFTWNISGSWEALAEEKEDVYETSNRMKNLLGLW